jgi:hypothetical protein
VQGAGSLLSARSRNLPVNAACQWVGSPGGREWEQPASALGSSLRAVTPVDWTASGIELALRYYCDKCQRPGACQWALDWTDGLRPVATGRATRSPAPGALARG